MGRGGREIRRQRKEERRERVGACRHQNKETEVRGEERKGWGREEERIEKQTGWRERRIPRENIQKREKRKCRQVKELRTLK